MKLELKHLAPYLPYRLMVMVFNEKPKVMNASSSSSSNWVGIGACVKWSENCKPILRPLSDLIKEITVGGYSDGKPFKPISDLVGLITQSGYNYNRVVSIKEEHDTITIEWPIVRHPKSSEGIRKFFEIDIDEIGFDIGWELWDADAKKDTFYSLTGNQFEFYQKLFQWHFDVFGLIEKGLAIDINTLEL